jgi:protein phosphatase 2C family protein 2/3
VLLSHLLLVYTIYLIVDDTCYVANVGDSRAVISKSHGKIAQPITNDHKPSEEFEEKRIMDAGGKIYQYMIII